ncbi:MAG: class I SAM-dependent methyltransferase [Myxococcales bacterium]|nr:class I SAM-dependent methyltransferase [Myxococcales bacterium]MCB9756439.1 class I SAM-dependent methyltransferase [Myxococcales bacterium]
MQDIDERARLPRDWSDVEGWNRYYRDLLADGRDYTWRADMRFLGHAYSLGRRVWFAGCGVALAPILYRDAGLDVLATDISTVAVERQQQRHQRPRKPDGDAVIRELLREHELPEEPERPGSFEARVHDFTEGPPARERDLVINARAFQGLSPDAMNRAARSHHDALRAGGHAIFDTNNVQGERRTAIEDALIGAGFYIPGNASERWYRERLAETGIVHIMILGRPRIPGRGQYPEDEFEQRAREDQAILDRFTDEYRARCAAENDEVQRVLNERARRVAIVVYNTG